MHIVRGLNELSALKSSANLASKSVGFVPTMGALHMGHSALIEQSLKENEATVVSVFVNPIQFNNQKDLDNYPRDLEKDAVFLKALGVDVLFAPYESEFYPSRPHVSIAFGALAKPMEGAFRAGHFEGVGLVVSKLLHLVSPDKAYFGLKDLQQFILIRQMCEDLSFSCEIIGVETVREQSGLAFSSRNSGLSDVGKKNAAVIYQGLKMIENGVAKRLPLALLVNDAKEFYDQSAFEWEYLQAVNPSDLQSVDDYHGLNELAVCVAGYIEGIRLIDNLYLRLK